MAEPTFIIGRRDGQFLVTTEDGARGGLRLSWVGSKDDATVMGRPTAAILRSVLCPAMANLEGWQVEGWPSVCTDASARWCPVCGDCGCRPECPGCLVRMVHDDQVAGWVCLECDAAIGDVRVAIPHDDPECQLHKADSQHAGQS